MDIRDDDVIYLVAVRTRAPNRGRAIQEVMRVLSLARADEDTDATAHVVAVELKNAYHVPRHDDKPAVVQNLNDVLRAARFDFDAANEVVPVATVAHG